MRLPLLLLMPTALTYLADCSARSTEASSNQRLRQSVDAVDVRGKENVKGQKFQRMLKAKLAKEGEDDEDPKKERIEPPPRRELMSTKAEEEILHVAARPKATSLAEFYAKAHKKGMIKDMNEIAKLKNIVTPEELHSLQLLFKKWSDWDIEPQLITESLREHGHKGGAFAKIIDGYLRYLRKKNIAIVKAEHNAKAAAGTH